MWESIKNKFRRNKHIEEEQKIETENLQNEEVTNSGSRSLFTEWGDKCQF